MVHVAVVFSSRSTARVCTFSSLSYTLFQLAVVIIESLVPFGTPDLSSDACFATQLRSFLTLMCSSRQTMTGNAVDNYSVEYECHEFVCVQNDLSQVGTFRYMEVSHGVNVCWQSIATLSAWRS